MNSMVWSIVRMRKICPQETPRQRSYRRCGSNDHARSCATLGSHLRSESILSGDHLTGRHSSFGGSVRHILQGGNIQGSFRRLNRRDLCFFSEFGLKEHFVAKRLAFVVVTPPNCIQVDQVSHPTRISTEAQ